MIPPPAASVAFCPAQMVAFVTVATGGGETTTVAKAVSAQLPFDEKTE